MTKICSTAMEAVSGIESGEFIWTHSMAATPTLLLNALYEHAKTKKDITVMQLHTEQTDDIPAEELEGRVVGLDLLEDAARGNHAVNLTKLPGLSGGRRRWECGFPCRGAIWRCLSVCRDVSTGHSPHLGPCTHLQDVPMISVSITETRSRGSSSETATTWPPVARVRSPDSAASAVASDSRGRHSAPTIVTRNLT